MRSYRIDLITGKGTFTFQNHRNSNADFVQAMILFEANNWEMLMEGNNQLFEYKLYTEFDDGVRETTTFKGVNAEPNLLASLEDEGFEFTD